MTTIIITTFLVSVLFTLVVGYFIWSGISVRKLKKQVKDNTSNISNNRLSIEEHYNSLIDINDETSNTIVKNYKDIQYVINEVENRFSQSNDNLINDYNVKIEEIYRQMDKRFDSVYKKIN